MGELYSFIRGVFGDGSSPTRDLLLPRLLSGDAEADVEGLEIDGG